MQVIKSPIHTIATTVGTQEMKFIITNVRTFEAAARVDAPTIRQILHTPEGYDRAVKMLTYAISHYLTISGQDQIPGIEQCAFIAQEIIDAYPEFTLTDINFLMRKGIAGMYGPIYGRIEIHTIAGIEGWAGKYRATHYLERIKIRKAHIHTQEAARALPSGPVVPPPPEFINLTAKLEAMAKKMEAPISRAKRKR